MGAQDDLLIIENGVFLNNEGDEDHAGRIVAIVRVAGTRPFVPADIGPACASYFEEGWLAGELVDVRPVASSQLVKAALGIYELEAP